MVRSQFQIGSVDVGQRAQAGSLIRGMRTLEIDYSGNSRQSLGSAGKFSLSDSSFWYYWSSPTPIALFRKAIAAQILREWR